MGALVADITSFASARAMSALDISPGGRVASVDLNRTDGPVAGLLDGALASKFHAWFGGSGRRYLTSVFPVARDAEDFGLPEFDSLVLISVVTRGSVRRALAIATIESGRDRRRAVGGALSMGADHWHVHLLGADSIARVAIVADLALRHARAATALSA